MYGDVGHGLIIFFLGLTFAKGRLKYLLLLCGFFATYCGMIYNEFFSVPLVAMDTCWENIENAEFFVRK